MPRRIYHAPALPAAVKKNVPTIDNGDFCFAMPIGGIYNNPFQINFYYEPFGWNIYFDKWVGVLIGTCHVDPGTSNCGGYIFSQVLWCTEVAVPEYDYYGLCT